MSVFRYKDKWKAEVWVYYKRIKCKSGFQTKAQAKEWHDDVIREFKLDPAVFRADVKSIKFDELLDSYIEMHLPTIRLETQRRYKIDIEQRIGPHFRFRPIGAVTPEVIARFRVGIMADLSRKSVNNCMSVLRAVFVHGVQLGLIKDNPFNLRPLKLPERKYRWWDDESDVLRFLEVAKTTPHYAAYRLAIDCGLRLGEIIGLSKQDIDFKLCQIHIHRQWIDKQCAYGPPKHNRERFVRFDSSSDLRDVLFDAVRQSPHSEAITVTRTGKRITGRKLAGCHFKKLIERAGVREICFHDLRHTFASWYMINVGDIWSLKGILGHSDIQTTQRYAHLSDKHLKVPNIVWGDMKKKILHAPFTLPSGSGV
jgi:integrase